MVGMVSFEISANVEMLRFFAAHPLP